MGSCIAEIAIETQEKLLKVSLVSTDCNSEGKSRIRRKLRKRGLQMTCCSASKISRSCGISELFNHPKKDKMPYTVCTCPKIDIAKRNDAKYGQLQKMWVQVTQIADVKIRKKSGKMTSFDITLAAP